MATKIPQSSQLSPPVLKAIVWLREYVDLAIAGVGGGGGGGVTAHSALTGLTTGDDHTQYHNDLRGDARYPLKSNNLSEFTATQATVRTNLGLGTASTLNVAATGNAAVGEVVKGNDTRLSDTRTPSANSVSATELQDNAVTVNKIFVQSVVNAKLANMASGTIKGRATAGAGVPEDLTAAQVSTILGLGTAATTNSTAYATAAQGTTADNAIPKSTVGAKGTIVTGTAASTPAGLPVGTNGQFLKADSTASTGLVWATLAGGGDVLAVNNLSEYTATQATARANIGVGNVGTLTSPGTTTTYLRGDATFVAPFITNVATGTPQALTAATDTYVTGSALALASRQKAGTVMRWRMSISKTAAGSAAPVFNLRWGTLGTTADTARFTFTGVAQTGAVDSAFVDIEVVVTTLNATTGQLAWSFRFGHNLQTTGFGTIPMQVSALSSGTFDTTTANAIVGVSINSGTSAAWTMRAVWAEAFNLV